MRTLAGIAITVIIQHAAALSAQAETALAEAYAQAWRRQPAVAALDQRQRAAAARIDAAAALTAAPPSLELLGRTDRFDRDQGGREVEVGIVLPIWLPGERSGSRAAAEAESEALAGRSEALGLRLALAVRDAWWSWQAAGNEAALAAGRRDASARLRDDVARRFAAGDVSRADLNQAEGALALAGAQQAEAEAAEAAARYRLESLTGQRVALQSLQPEPEPAAADALHPLLRELRGQSEVARRNAELARVQSRANPELAVSTRRDRLASSDPTEQTWALALRFPFGGGPRHDARIATANADAVEAEVALERERERLEREAAAVRQQVAAARVQLAAAEQRARLAGENRVYFEKSFRLGETDLPTRLRIENEAFEAERALGRARIALAQGISQLRQALGLLPE